MARAPSDIVAIAVAVVAGVLSWDLVRLLGEKREAWDDPDYWLVAFPLMLFTAFLLGLALPRPAVALGRRHDRRPGRLGPAAVDHRRRRPEPFSARPVDVCAAGATVPPRRLRRQDARRAGGGVSAMGIVPEQLRMIEANAAIAVEELSALSQRPFGFDEESVAWVEGFIERQRESLDDGDEQGPRQRAGQLPGPGDRRRHGCGLGHRRQRQPRHRLRQRRHGVSVHQGRQAARAGRRGRRVRSSASTTSASSTSLRAICIERPTARTP